MGKIKASMADVSTEFKLVEPGIYEFEIDKITEVENDGEVQAYRVNSKVQAPGEEMHERTLSDYINLRGKDGEFNEYGLANLKRYFEVTHGKEDVESWEDDDYDTDLLIGRRWRGQVIIDSYTKKGETEPRTVNKITRMEPV